MHSLRPLPHTARRAISTTASRPASVLFALGALSNSRETQHFNKLSRLQRIEHSPPLKLIKNAEVDPFPLPTPPPSNSAALPATHASRQRDAGQYWDAKALWVGRTVLADNARMTFRLRKALERSRRREHLLQNAMTSQAAAWAKERRKMESEMRGAGMWILLSVGTATSLAMWRFWPEKGGSGGAAARDSGQMGRRIAEKAQNAMPLPRVSAAVQSPPIGVTGPTTSGLQAAGPAALSPTLHKPQDVAKVQTEGVRNSGTSWWKGLFWKQQ